MNFFNSQYDFVGIGDVVTDDFIKLKYATVENGDGDGYNKICMRFGDKIPYESATVIPAVGNSSNASVSAARLGLRSAFVTNIGDDQNGKECLDALKREAVDCRFIKIHKNKKTNYHYVLMFGIERTILIKHEEFDYSLPDIGDPKCVYLSSLGENSLPFHGVIEKYLNEHPNIKFAFQPGTYQIKFGRKALAGIYKKADIFTCNKQEAQRILEIQESDIKILMKAIYDLGPKIVAITDGPNGAYAYNGVNFWYVPIYPDPKPPTNRTGAGDAFSSTFTVALVLGKTVEEALMWGPINSMSVVQQLGARAGLLAMKDLQVYLEKAPKFYKPQLI